MCSVLGNIPLYPKVNLTFVRNFICLLTFALPKRGTAVPQGYIFLTVVSHF